MGFFSSSQTQENTSRYDNPELRQYTLAYRTTAPWIFASLDPTATLAAMGKGSTVGGQKLGAEYKTYLQGLSAEEKQQHKASSGALERIRARQESGEFLTPQESEFISTQLDKAFEYAHKTGFEDWTRGTQMMAGSRGMRMSDSPVADPALRNLRDFELGLGSKRAEMQLGATLDFSKNQQEFDANFMGMLNALNQNRQNARQGFLFGGGLQGAGSLGHTTFNKQVSSAKMSTFQKVMAGMQMVAGAQALGTNAATMGMTGTPSSNVGGSELGSSQGWGQSAGSIMGGMMGGASAMSDRRLKSNIQRIGTHDTGIGIYSYIIGGQHQIGVMADEVKTVRPEAVTRHTSGYDMVNYSLL